MKLLKLAPLAIGTFAIGTDLFMITGILPLIGKGLDVSLAATGALVTVFAIVSAVSAPILATFFGHRDRRLIAMASMVLFAFANLLGAVSINYGLLLFSRIIAAVSAALYTPAATTLAISKVAPEHRGKAISIVTGGLTVSLILGVPIGTLIGHLWSWRATYLFVALIALVALVGVAIWFPRMAGSLGPNLRERLAPLKQPMLALTLTQTMIVIAGTFVVYTYLGTFIARYIISTPVEITLLLLIYGTGAILGNFGGGRIIDRLGPNKLAVIAVAGMAVFLGLLSVIGMAAHQLGDFAAILFGTVLLAWATIGWAFSPAQYARIAHTLNDQHQMQIAFALNGSALQLGAGIGALFGQWLVSKGLLTDIGWGGLIFEVVGLLLFVIGFKVLGMNVKNQAVENQQ